MRLGISALAGAIEGAVRTCAENGLNHIEVGIDDVGDWKYVKHQIDNIRSAGISLGVHLPMELNPCERVDEIRRCWERFVLTNIEIGRQLGVRYYNMHMGYALERAALGKRQLLLGNVCAFLSGICMKLERGEMLTLENSYSSGGDLVNMGTRASDFKQVFELFKQESLGFCFDTGHNLICKDAYMESLSDITKVIHLSGNDSVSDLHLGISGEHGIDDKLLAALLGLQGVEFYVLEMNSDFYKTSISRINELMGRSSKAE